MYHAERVGTPPHGLNGDLGLRYQDVGGRIPHQPVKEKMLNQKMFIEMSFLLKGQCMVYH